MRSWLREFALCFAAGCAGGFAKCAVAWASARLGVTILIGAHGVGALNPGFMYPRIIWGGLWAWLFVLPFLRRSVVVGGLIAGCIVTAVQWLVLPLWRHGGLDLSALDLSTMPLLEALLLNLIWGWVSALLLRWL